MCKQIPLSRGKVALVSDEDYERVAAYKWSLDRNGYAVRRARVALPDGTQVRRKVMLHRFILGAPKGYDVDHVNRDPLDNRRENIRIATRSQNMANMLPRPGSFSLYKGVFKAHGKGWRVEIRVRGVKLHVGNFDDEIEAAKAYDRAAYEAWGEFAYLNFPQDITSAS